MKSANRRWRILAVLALVPLAGVPELLAQGCAMCKTVAAGQSSEAAAALNLGILFLLVPPVAIMSGLLLFAFRCRNPRPAHEADASACHDDVASTAA
jgi:hypothetical protein